MFRADETNFRDFERKPRRFRRRSPLFAGGTRYALRHARRGGSSSFPHEKSFKLLKLFSVISRGNPNGFPLAAAYFKAHRKEMPRLHPFREPRCRQMECAAQKRGSSRRFCFELSKQNLPIERALPSLLVVARRCLRAARDTRSATLGTAAPPLSLTKKVLSC